MNEKIQKLYDLYTQSGLLNSTDLNTFASATPEQQQKLYDLGVSKGLFKSVDFSTFSTAFQVKKKDEAVPPAEETTQSPQQQPAAMASPSGVSSSASPSGLQEFKGFSPEQLSGLQASAQEAPEVARIKAEPAMAAAREKALAEDRARIMAENKAMEGYKETPYFEGDLGNAIRSIPVIGNVIDDWGRAVAAGSAQADLATQTAKLGIQGPDASKETMTKYLNAVKATEKYGPSEEMVEFTKVANETGGVWGFVKGILLNPSVAPELVITSARSLINPASATVAGTVVGGSAAVGSAFGGVGAIPAVGTSIPYAMGLANATLETSLSFSEFLNEELDKRGLELTDENVRTVLEDEDALSKIRARAASRGITIGVIDALTGRIAGQVGAKMSKAGKLVDKVKGITAAAGIEAVGGSTGEATARALVGQEMDIKEIGLEGVGEMPMAIIDVAAEVMRSPRYKVNGEVRTKEDVQEIIRTATPEQLQNINFDIRNDRDNLNQQIQDKVETGQLTNEIRQVNPNLNDDAVNALVSLERELRSLENNKTQAAKNKSAEIRSTIKDIQDTGVVPAELVPAPTPTAPAAEAPTAETKPITSEQITNPDVKSEINEQIGVYEDMLANDEAWYNEKKAEWDKKGIFAKAFGVLAGTKPSYDKAVSYAKKNLDMLRNNPEAFFQQKLEDYNRDLQDLGEPEPDAWVEYRNNLEIALQAIKEEKDAIQKQAAGQVPVQPRAGGRQEVAQGEPQAGPQEVTQEGQAQEGVVSSRTLEEQVSALEQMMTEEDTNDLIDEFALAVDTVDDAQAALSRGDLVYVFDETTETPTLVSDATVLAGYTPDRIAVVPRENSPMAQQPQAQPQMSWMDFAVAPITPTENVVVGSNKAQLDSVRAQTTDATKRRVLDMVESGARVLKALFPNVEIAVHTTKESYNEAMRMLEQEGETKGLFSYARRSNGEVVGGRIDIDLSSADGVTVAHEIAHAVMLKAFGENPALFKTFRGKISKILSDSTLKQLNDFADQYSETDSHEEFLVQLAGMLTDNAQELSRVEPTTIQKIADAINSIMSTITGGRFVPFEGTTDINQLVDFFNTITRSIREGEPIGLDVEQINELGLHGNIVSDGVRSKASIVSGQVERFPVNPNTRVENNVPLSRFSGKTANLMESDRMIGGFIADSEGRPMYKFFGGVYYPIITGKWWASRNETKAKGIAKNANNNRDKDGYIYSAPMIGSGNQHMSNSDMLFVTLELMKSDALKKGSKVTKEDLISYIKKAFQRKDVADKYHVVKKILRKSNNISTIFNELQFFLFQEGDKILDRGVSEKKDKKGQAIPNYVFDDNGKTTPNFTFEQRLSIVEGILGDPKIKDVKFPSAGSISAAAKRFEEPITEKVSAIGDMVAIFRTKGRLEYKKSDVNDEFYHKSYPFEIYAVDENGNPAEVEVYILDKAYSMKDVLPKLNKSTGGEFTWDEYISKHKKEKVAAAQYSRTAKLSSASGKLIAEYEKADAKDKPKAKKKAQVAIHKDTGFVPVGFWVEELKGKTAYLDEVVKNILNAREELKEGKVKERKVVKSYLITLASMGSGGGYFKKWAEKTGKKISDVFLEKVKGKDWIRPEGSAAAYLVTPDGEKLVDDIINGTATPEQIKRLFVYVGVGRENSKTDYVVKTMQSGGLKAMTDLFNENKGSNFSELYAGAIKNLKGIAQGKTGFFNQYFGVAERGVVDARELNAWIAGSMKLTEEQKAKKKQVAASKKLSDQLLGYIEQVGIELGYPKDLAGYIAHHAIWDAIAKSVTTHQGEYMVVSKAQVKEEGAGKEKYKVAIVFKSKFGGRKAKPYEFNDKRHFENWLKKYGDKYDISDIYELNSKAQLSKLRGLERIVELGRASGFSNDAITIVLQKKGYSQSEIDEALKTKKAASKVVVDETFVEGYDRMMSEVDGIIEKGLRRGSTQEQILDNVINYIQGSKAYENATDVQREQLIRDARAAFGKKEKAAPKVERVLGTIKDVKNITMSEYQLLKKQIKDYAKGAKDATKAWRLASESLTKDLRELVRGGKITSKQAVAVLRRFSKVNMFDPNSIESFVNYMTKVFENAEYAERISGLRKKLKLAKDSASRKIGIAEGLYPMLNRMLSIDPTLIPDSVLDTYAEIVEMLGKRDAVLKLQDIQDVTDKTKSVLDAVDSELSTLETLSEIFEQYADKVVDANGVIQFADTLDAMVSDGTITNDDAKILRKYKNKVMPRAAKPEKTEQQLQDEKDEMIKALASTDIDANSLPTQDERDLARELQKLKGTDAVNNLSNTELEKLLLVIDNINNGYLPHYAQLMKEKLNAINNEKALESSVKKAKPLSATKLYARLKSLFYKNSKALDLMVQRTPLFYIDQVFGDFKTKDIFNSILKPISDAMGVFNLSIQRVEDKLNGALDEVAKSHKNDPKKTKMSSYKMMTYMLQLEFMSNPDSVGVNPASEFLKATIKHIRAEKSHLSDIDADMLQEILDTYSDSDGNIDSEKLFKSFNPAEKKALDTIKGINVDMRDKAVFTAHIIRGDKLTPLNNYVHHNVLHEFRPEENISGVTSAEEFNNMMQPSTRGKSLISRTKGVKPLDFNVFSATQRGANYVLMDYYLTEPIRTARKTINATESALEGETGMNKKDRDTFNAIRNSFEAAVRNTLMTRFHNNTFADEVVNFVTKNGYRAVLASTTRWIGELTSNMGFIMFADRASWLNGVQNYMDVVSSPNSIDILTNLKSSQSARLYPSDTLSGRMIDSSMMNQASGTRGGRTRGDIANTIQRIYNNSLKKYQNFVETTADSLISTPDKIMMRPYWFGSFAKEFKSITGKEPNFDLIAENNEAYMTENKDALEQAKTAADEKSVLAGASDNPFMGILKGQITPDMNSLLKAFNVFNNYMTRFLIYEYSTARTGVMAAIGNGSISRKQGAALLGGVATRMVLYSLLTSTLSNVLVGMFVDDEDEDDEKSLLQKTGQAMASGMSALLLGRDFGNATRAVINYGVERMNEEFLTGLRSGDYDPYKDAIAYSAFASQSDKATLQDYAINMMGPLTPIAKTTALIVKKASGEPKKEAAARGREQKEIEVRIPLEILGNVGLVPLYKDVRKVVMADIYKGMKKELGKTKDQSSEFQLPFEMNKEDMERYYPEMYKQMYGKGSLDYELKQMEKALKSQSEEIERKMKDEMYNYTPKKKEKD